MAHPPAKKTAAIVAKYFKNLKGTPFQAKPHQGPAKGGQHGNADHQRHRGAVARGDPGAQGLVAGEVQRGQGRDPGVREVLNVMGPATLSSGMLQINVFVSLFFASGMPAAAATRPPFGASTTSSGWPLTKSVKVDEK